MSSFAPPSGPPPPSVPEGWKAQYDERYHAWFYVDLATGKSQWDRPEASPQRNDGNPPAHSPPPSYDNAGPGDPAALAGAGDKKHMGSNNPYNPTNTGPSPSPGPNTIDEDARLAAKLQAEEDARAGGAGSRGASDDYYAGNAAPQSGSNYAAGLSQSSQSPVPEQAERSKGGFLSKLMGKKLGKRPQQQQQYASYSQQGPPPGSYYGGGGYPPQPGPQPGYGYPQPGYGGGGYGGYQQQGGYYQQQPPRRQGGGGMGTAGAAALGVGGGLLGGMLIADAMEDHHDDYGNNDYGGGGDDYGGGGDDFGGGDF